MKENELILLGLLKESPKHPYQIKKEIKQMIFPFLGLDLKSIYYPLKVMERKGLVERVIEQKKDRPLRYIYKLTKRGEERFLRLLNQSFLNFKRPQFSLDICLYFLSYLKPHLVHRRLKARIFLLKKLLKELKKTIISFKQDKTTCLKASILEHDCRMVEVELKFLLSLIKNLS